jgi:hypothetical protein
MGSLYRPKCRAGDGTVKESAVSKVLGKVKGAAGEAAPLTAERIGRGERI